MTEEHSSSNVYKLRVRNARQIVQVSVGKSFLVGSEMDSIAIVENAGMVVNHNGTIHCVAPEEEIEREFGQQTFDSVLDATGKSIIPGFVDGHTHPVWSGDRVHEFAMKLAGATYMEVHAKGGGIGFTVRHTKESSEEELLHLLLARLNRMIRFGSTVVECKSGYGLECETEMKMLRVIHQAKKHTPAELVTTFLGAHSVPKGSTASEATDDVISVQLPKLVELRERGEISPDNVDVFLERGVFDREQTRRILLAGREAGLEMNFHGDEIHPMNAGELAGELSALAVSHLERVSDEGIKAMAIRPSFAVLLPTTAYVLRLEPPPARKLIEGGVPVALGSDYNPNAHCLSMPHVMNLACVLMHMTMNEALVAATINSAASLGRSEQHGSLEPGKCADFVLIDAPSWEHVIYEMADPPIAAVYIRGNAVHVSAQSS